MKCPSCLNGRMRRITGKFGPFLGCTNYPDCDAIISIFPGDRILKLECTECGWPVVSRLSETKNRYYRCTYKNCGQYIDFKIGARHEKDAVPCPVCEDGVLVRREGRLNPYGFFGCINYPSCRFTVSLFHHYDNITKKTCPECSYPLVSRYSKKSKKRYFKCTNKVCEYVYFPQKSTRQEKTHLVERHVKRLAEKAR